MKIIADLFTLYFYFRRTHPFLLYGYYLYAKDKENAELEKLIQTFLLFVFCFMIYASANLLIEKPFSAVIPFGWGYAGLITWGVFFTMFYIRSFKITSNNLKAFTLSTLATVGAGWLYEMPFFHPTKMFFSNQILCLLLLGYELKKMGFRKNVIIISALSVFMLFSSLLFLDFYHVSGVFKKLTGNSRLFAWIVRIPACLFLISLLWGIENS